MSSQGDITDTFDDADDLVRSVQQGAHGPWTDDKPEFVDPAVFKLQEELKKPQVRDYQQRRMLELQQRLVAQDQPDATKDSGINWGDPDIEDWSGNSPTPARKQAEQTTKAPQPATPAAEPQSGDKTKPIGVVARPDAPAADRSKGAPAAVWIAVGVGIALLAGLACVLLIG